MITEIEILNFQKEWADGIINIGRSYNNGDEKYYFSSASIS